MPAADLTALGRLVATVSPAGLPALGAKLDRAVEGITTLWVGEVQPRQLDAAAHRIRGAVHAQDLDALVALAVPVLGEASLLAAMQSMSAAGAASVAAEARAQGAPLDTPPPLASLRLADWARATARRLADAFAGALGKEALRLFRPGVTAEAVEQGVRTYAAELTDRGPRDALGGALVQAMNLGRISAYAQAPPGWRVRLFADETLDNLTCLPCRDIDGTELPPGDAAMLAYGGAGYLFCKGKERCRGTMVGHWERLSPGDAFLQRVRVQQFDGGTIGDGDDGS